MDEKKALQLTAAIVDTIVPHGHTVHSDQYKLAANLMAAIRPVIAEAIDDAFLQVVLDWRHTCAVSANIRGITAAQIELEHPLEAFIADRIEDRDPVHNGLES